MLTHLIVHVKHTKIYKTYKTYLHSEPWIFDAIDVRAQRYKREAERREKEAAARYRREAEQREKDARKDMMSKARAPTVPKHSRDKPGFSLDDHKYNAQAKNDDKPESIALTQLAETYYNDSCIFKDFLDHEYTKEYRATVPIDIDSFLSQYGPFFYGADETTGWLYDNYNTTAARSRDVFKRLINNCGFVWPAGVANGGERTHSWKLMKYYLTGIAREWSCNRLDGHQHKIYNNENNLFAWYQAWLIISHIGPLLIQRALWAEQGHKWERATSKVSKYKIFPEVHIHKIQDAVMSLHELDVKYYNKKKAQKAAKDKKAKAAKQRSDTPPASGPEGDELKADELKAEETTYITPKPRDDDYIYSEEDDEEDTMYASMYDGATRTQLSAVDHVNDEVKNPDPTDIAAANDPKATGKDNDAPVLKQDPAKTAGGTVISDAMLDEIDMDIISVAGSAQHGTAGAGAGTGAGAGAGSEADSDFSLEMID